MELTNKEWEALSAYFDVTNINITNLISKIGKEKVKNFEKIIDKTVEFDKTKTI
jgi:hypothetical protein